MIEEFKKFISRGNVIDLAVGVIIGGAFGKIISSLVDDIIMPIIGVIIGGIDFSSLAIKVKDATISYGMFIQNVIDFLIIALCIFFIVKLINKFNDLAAKKLSKKKEEEKKEEVPEVSEEIKLLREINSSLKKIKK